MVLSNDSSVQQRLQTKETFGFAAVAGQCWDKLMSVSIDTKKRNTLREGFAEQALCLPLLNTPASSSGCKKPLQALPLCCAAAVSLQHMVQTGNQVQILKPGFVC